MRYKIIDTAKEVYLEKGINDTNLNDIAKIIGTSRRTIYRHFESKEELLFEVVAVILEEWNQLFSDFYSQLEKKSKLEQLEDSLLVIVDKMDNSHHYIKLLAEFDLYCGDNFIEEYKNKTFNHYNQVLFTIDDYLYELICDGIKEKSIQTTDDPKLIVATISTMLWSFSQRSSYRKETIAVETGFSHQQIMNEQIKMYITSLKGESYERI